VVDSGEASIGQDEHILGLEPLGQRQGSAAIGWVGAGGLSPCGLPENAPKQPRQFAYKKTGAAALIDRLLAPLLDEGREPAGKLRGIEPLLDHQLVDQLSAKPLQVRIGKASRPAHASLAKRREPRCVLWISGHAALQQQLRQDGLGKRVEPDHLAPRDYRLELELRSGADQDQDGPRWRLFQGFQKCIGSFVVHVVKVIHDRDLPRPPCRLQAEFRAEVANHLDGQLLPLVRPRDLQ